MVDIKIVASGTCAECGHSQKDHEGNTICDVEGCDCTNIGSYQIGLYNTLTNTKYVKTRRYSERCVF